MKSKVKLLATPIIALGLAALIVFGAVAAPLLAIVKTVVDDGGGNNVGTNTSLALDSDGNPVISYYDEDAADLKLAHCHSFDCSSVTITIVDGSGGDNVGDLSSLVLDAAGNPVISYYDGDNEALKLAHCHDPNCSSATINTVDDGGGDRVGLDSSLALDAAGNPVISYYDSTNHDLKLAHCDDANCGIATINIVDGGGGDRVGTDSSLELDAVGNPVISYYDASNGDLKLAHCDDVDCGSATINTVDGSGGVFAGTDSSLALDANGYPVISYFTFSTSDLKLAHCEDADCASATINTVDGSGGTFVGTYTSVVLDSSGNPVISYYDAGNDDLKLAECEDPDCDNASFVVLDDGGGTNDVGYFTSLLLDCAANPVVSYKDGTAGALKLASDDSGGCGTAAAGSSQAASPDGPNPSASKDVTVTGTTTLTLDDILVSVPAAAISGQTNCRIEIEDTGNGGDYGFQLNDSVWDVNVVCDSGVQHIFFAPITVCIRPDDGVVNDKQVFHRHTGESSFTGLANTYDVSGYVCGQTRVLSLFTLGDFSLPATGFAPGVQAELGEASSYVATGLQLSIPEISLYTEIVGVPQGPNGWDVSWLGDSAGYLVGTAFPTLAGNTVITAHVWGADNQPGPFYQLEGLTYGDRFSIEAWGRTYTYEVRSNTLYSPSSISPLGHEDYDWVTLVTCQGFDEASEQYIYRRVVRAVLVSVD